VNLRVQHEKLPPIRYSFVLLRVIHYILDLHRRHPNTRIYLCKFDIDAAYRQCTLSSATAMESLTILDDFLLLALRMTFGGSPNLVLWGVISEMITDIGNSLLVNDAWNHLHLFDQISNSIEEPQPLADSVPFHQAKDLSISIPPNDCGKIDIFIDNSIGVAPDLGDVPTRVCRAIPLAIRTVARPASTQDIIPRKDIILLKKLQAEGRLEELKTVLGWVINTRSLLIALPDHKFHGWTKEIDKLSEAGKSNYKSLETLLGRLNHVACILMPMRHFMGRLYRALYCAKARLGWTKFSQSELDDLSLHKKFLRHANKGVSLNIIAFRKPTIILRSDACEFGLGGYNIASGKAWRWEIPTELRNRTSINSLEFIACVISIWVDIIHQNVQPEDCLLSQTDNTTEAGWLKKSNFAEEKDEFIQLHTARHLASLVMDTGSCIYSQWFPGENNSISDSLSRDFHIDSNLLCHMLSLQFPSQVPFGLSLLPLPNEIVSWVTSLLQSQQQTEPWSKAPQRSSFALGSASKATFSQLVSSMTPFSMASIRGQRHKILSAFGQFIREGRFNSGVPKLLKADSVRAALDCMAQAFKLAVRPDPRLNTDGKLAFILQRQLCGYKSTDPGEKPQVALTGSILRKFYHLAISPFDKAMCQLFIGAFFFAMQSCEYVKVQGPRKTKLLTIQNIRFFIGNRQIKHSDPHLSLADCVSIMFEYQKRDVKNDVITQHRSGDKVLCPVKMWAAIVWRITSYPGASASDSVNLFCFPDGKKHLLTGTELLKRICQAATLLGPDSLGFTSKEIGLHSARSRADMAMYLAHVPVFTIMLLGRWSSDAFLRYIRKQIKEFSNGISSNMIQKEHFFTVPSTSLEDPRTANNPLNLAVRNNFGPHSFKETIRPLASVFH
jgi:hypothetical protein